MRRERLLRLWLVGYVFVLLGTLPLALPAWDGFLRDLIGPYITIEQIHIAQYAVLGCLAALYARGSSFPRRMLAIMVVAIAGIGLCDELIQMILPGRFFDWRDVGLNLAGGIIGMIVASGARLGMRLVRGRRIVESRKI